MPRWLHICVQIALLAASTISSVHFANPYIGLIGGFLMGVVAIINQAYNTDGTPQTAAFVPKNQQQANQTNDK